MMMMIGYCTSVDRLFSRDDILEGFYIRFLFGSDLL